MRFTDKEIKTKDGRTAVLRNAKTDDADMLINYLRITALETPFLVREPEEIIITREQEEAFIKQQNESERSLLLIATIDGKHIGNCSMSPIGAHKRYLHRCSVAIALYKEYCSLGLGRQMMTVLLEKAKICGYEQAELEVVTANRNAITLYKSLGFEIYGTLKNDMKYKDGSYSDVHLMVKYL